MKLSDLSNTHSYRLTKVLSLLESKHGVTLNFDAVDSLSALREYYNSLDQRRVKMLKEGASSVTHADATYSKVSLIQEAIRIYFEAVAQ